MQRETGPKSAKPCELQPETWVLTKVDGGTQSQLFLVGTSKSSARRVDASPALKQVRSSSGSKVMAQNLVVQYSNRLARVPDGQGLAARSSGRVLGHP
jgi:hypothetical protein